MDSTVPLGCLACPAFLEGRLKVPLGLESWNSLWNREELVTSWGCSSGLLQGYVIPRVLRNIRGQGRSCFGGVWMALFLMQDMELGKVE